MRKLAHVEIIDSLSPIDGADRIEVARVLGWECVVKKGEFKVGEKIIYVEVDSVMPEKPEYEFLRDRKFRIRTIKLKGQVSQGLVLPITEGNFDLSNLPIGADVTESLGITKYLSPYEQSELQKQEEKIKLEKNKLKKFMMRYSWFRKIFLSRSQKQGFPYWVSKTDEERVQNIPQRILDQYKDEFVYVTEKIDYQSVTFTGKMIPMLDNWIGRLFPKTFKFIVCSRNFTTEDRSSLYWEIANKYSIEQILRKNPTLTIQGEQGDSKVQGNKYGIKESMFWVFNIIDHEKNYHYNYFEMREFCDNYNLKCVPMVHLGTYRLCEIGTSAQDFVEFSKGKSLLADIPREGVVIRAINSGKKILSFKAINPDFLLKYE